MFRSFDLLKLVQDHGQPATLRQLSTAGSYNPATGTISGSATTDYSVEAYFYNYENGLNQQVDVRRGVRKCLISAIGLAVVPDDGDKLVGVNDTVEIVSVMSIFNGPSPVCYICDVRE